MELYYVHRPTIAIFKIYTSVISIRTSMKDWLLFILNEEKRNPENYFCVCSVKIIFLQFLPHFENDCQNKYCKMYNWNIYFHFFLSLAILLYYDTKTKAISFLGVFFSNENLKCWNNKLKSFNKI